jgi:glyoxylase-like metal-dependent hydrolase (beta-lactamase superfamily II)
MPETFITPTWTTHIGLPGASILVDPNDYDLSCPPGSPSVPAGYRPDSLPEQLREIGVNPDEVTHVVITHRHFDHYAGVTKKEGSRGYVPSFPRARHLLGRADWESTEILRRDAIKYGVTLADPEEDVRSLGVINRAGLLDLLDAERTVSPQVQILRAPGESPGHQIVRVHSAGQTFYCVGDLYHHPIEVENPETMAPWANPETNVRSRHALAPVAESEGATVVAGHMAIGRIERTSSGFRWVES